MQMNEENFAKIVPMTPEKYEQDVTQFERITEETKKLNSEIVAIKRLSGII